MRNLCIIPARAGSKGIKNKNMVDLGGKPLLQWSLELVRNLSGSTLKVLMTDMKEAKGLAKEFPEIQSNIDRPAYLSGDGASVIDLALFMIQYFFDRGEDIDVCSIIQPTSPFRRTNEINGAIEYFQENNLDSLVAVSPVWHHPAECVFRNSRKVSYVVPTSANVEGRQNFKAVDFISGAFYIAKKEWLIRNKTFCNEDSVRYPMSFYTGIDIDDPEHLEVARGVAGQLNWTF